MIAAHRQLVQEIHHLISVEQYAAARSRLDQLAASAPESSDVPQLWSYLALRTDDYPVAEQQARRAISLDANDPFSFLLLSHALRGLHRTKEALKAAQQAVLLDPLDASYRNAVAEAHLLLDQYPAAEAAAREGLRLDPDHLASRNLLATALNLQGQRDEAALHIDDVLALDPESDYSHANAGHGLLRRAQIADARTHFLEALRINPRNSAARAGLAEVIKATNPLYRGFLKLSFWMQEMSARYRWGLIIGLLLVVNVLPILAVPYLILLLWTWFTAPLSEVYLLLHPTGRHLIERKERPYVLAIGLLFVAALLLGAASWVLTLPNGSGRLAICLLLLVLPVYRLSDLDLAPSTRRYAWAWTVGFVALCCYTAYVVTLGLDQSMSEQALLFGVIAYSWLGTRR